jgi:hypothetical protein
MNGPSTVQKTSLALGIGAVALLLAHAIEAQTKASRVLTSRASTARLEPGSESARAQAPSPPGAVRAGSELVAVKGPTFSLPGGSHATAGVNPAAARRVTRAPLRPDGPVRSTLVLAHGVAPAVDGNRFSVLSLRLSTAGASLLAARACWLEGGFSLADCAAVVHVIKRRARRAGWPFERMLVAYSAIDADNPRAAFARQLPAGAEPSWSPRENERWSMVREIAAAALDGRVSSPCRGARDWGAPNLANDVGRAQRAIDAGKWRRIQCGTRNRFYGPASASVIAATEAAGVARP